MAARCGARLAWRGMTWRGIAWRGMAWHGMVWYGVACARGGPSLHLASSHFVFSLPLDPFHHPSRSICVCACIVLPFFRVLRLDRSRSPSRPALTGVKIEPLWRARVIARTSLLAAIDHPSQSMLTMSGSVWLRSTILKFARLLERINCREKLDV